MKPTQIQSGGMSKKLPGGGDHAERGGGGELARKEAKAGGDNISGRQSSKCKALE